MAKRYGKLSLEHLQQLVQLMPTLDTLSSEYRADMRRGEEKWRRMIANGLMWSQLYEKSVNDLIVHFVVVSGLGRVVKDALAAAVSAIGILEPLRDRHIGASA